jgi:hypothetical protein
MRAIVGERSEEDTKPIRQDVRRTVVAVNDRDNDVASLREDVLLTALGREDEVHLKGNVLALAVHRQELVVGRVARDSKCRVGALAILGNRGTHTGKHTNVALEVHELVVELLAERHLQQEWKRDGGNTKEHGQHRYSMSDT